MIPRLASGIWVAAYLRRLGSEGIFAHIAHKGDNTAGAITIKLALMNGRAVLYQRAYDIDGQAFWDRARDETDESAIDQAIARLRQHDRDLWVIEVEDPRGRHLLDEIPA